MQVVSQHGECRPLMSSHCANNNEIARTTGLGVKLTTDHKSRKFSCFDGDRIAAIIS